MATRCRHTDCRTPVVTGRVRAMRNPLLTLLAMACATAAWAEGPGSRIRSSPEAPQALTQTPASDQAKACERLRTEERKRCLEQVRDAPTPRGSSGPGATGTGSGAASTGMSGGASAGTTTPR